MSNDLQSKIYALIDLKDEGNYWDFKREWHVNKADLLHDIICLCNVIHNGDRYIIIGVDNQYNVCGVGNDANRKNQEQLIDFLRDKKFSVNYRPTIVVKTITFGDKELDVIVVSNSTHKPFYLTEPYSDAKKTVRANNIYSRIGPTNTPQNSQCPQSFIEEMWRERFGLLLTPLERLYNLLGDIHGWERKEHYHYHKLFPEFRIEFEEPQKCDIWGPYRYCYPDPDYAEGIVKFYYHSTVIKESAYMYVDGYHLRLPYPELERSKKYDMLYCYLTDEFSGVFLKYLTANPPDYEGSPHSPFDSLRGGYAPFLLFKSKFELKEFISYLDNPDNTTLIESLQAKNTSFFHSYSDKLKQNQALAEDVNKLYRVDAAYKSWLTNRLNHQ